MGTRRKRSRDGAELPFGPIRRFGRYTLIRKLATGGMAEIWLAQQRGLAGFNRFVVIKKILTHLSEQATFVKMFLDEARTSAQLNHPNIVQIYDLGREGGSYYIAMEFIAGESLAAIAWRGMKRCHPFGPSYAARVIADTCKALHYAHHLKGPDGRPLELVHRDISPQNILVTYEGGVKVVDFGIAKARSKSEHTKTGILKGKYSYMSPEQCVGAVVDMRSDIFSLGILLYELCTGKRLFKHESELMILEMITKRGVVPPSHVTLGISHTLEDIIMRALAKDVDARFPTAQAMQVALEEFLREEGDPATTSDVATYMRQLFADRIEEEGRLRELASRHDFDAHFEAEAQTSRECGGTRSPPRGPRPARARASKRPSGVVVTGATPRAEANHQRPPRTAMPRMSPARTAPPPPGRNGSWPYPDPTPGGHGSYRSYPEVLHDDVGGGWWNRVVIATALLVIVVAGAILIRQFTSRPGHVNRSTPATPRQTGSFALNSIPSGATILLDGTAMRAKSGQKATTPSNLHALQYGVPYRFRLVKTGYRPYETTVVMNAQVDGSTITPELEAFPGRLLVEVRGERKGDTRVYFDGEDAGLGPRIVRSFPGARSVLVEANLNGKPCRASPPRVTIVPNETKTIEVRCSRFRRAAGPHAPQRNGRTAPAPSRPKPSGCVNNPDLPKGRVTIDTTPFSDIYYRGRKLGQTPLSKQPLPAGCVEITAVFTKNGREVRQALPLHVRPAVVSKFRIDLLK